MRHTRTGSKNGKQKNDLQNKSLPTFARVTSRLALYLLLALAACHTAPDQPAENSAAATHHTVRDDLGRLVRLPTRPRRVVSLAPSMTEMLFAVADPAQLVGRTQNCNYPAAALKLPVVNAYPLDVEALVKLRPDAVFSVEGMTSPGHLAQLAELGIPVYQQAYDSVVDIPRGLQELGRLLGREERGKAVADSLRESLESMRSYLQSIRSRGDSAAKPLRILAITWTDPIYVYGYPTLFSDALRWVGNENAVWPSIAQPFPVLPRETVLKLNPDVLIGGDFAALDSTLFRKYPELKQISAYRTRGIYAVDDDLLSRPSPRIGRLLRALFAPPPQKIKSTVRFVAPPKAASRQ